MMTTKRWVAMLGMLTATSLMACAAEEGEGGQTGGSQDDDLRVRGQAAWFYSGSLPALQNAKVTVSLKGHTARVEGYLPDGYELPELPHVRSRVEADGRTKLDIVYPVATGRSYNASAGNYAFERAIPYRPDGNTFTVSDGNHWVTWGGFPFLGYRGTIALHGPITDVVAGDRSQRVWYLKRGTVSSGCNRMLGEHVIELAHLTGVNMRKVYSANQSFRPERPARVVVISDYDRIDGKYIDVDYPTDTGVVRPGVAFGTEQVEMFGSWVAAELPDGSDLPASLKWEGGVRDKWYVFKEHATYDTVCSVLPEDLRRVRTWAATLPNKELPADFCQRKDCVVAALADGTDPAVCEVAPVPAPALDD